MGQNDSTNEHAACERIDAHHHLWRYNAEDYGWIDDSMHVLRRDFLASDLLAEARAMSVDGSIAVQARQTLEETRWLLHLASESSILRGVVGWAPLGHQDLPRLLEPFLANPLLKGLRHVVQAEPDGFLDRNDFNRGITFLESTGLVYDLLIVARQLPETIRFVDRHPNQTFVLDHIAKPDIAHMAFEPWNSQLRELARRDNVLCKLSGMVTEADWFRWTPAQLAPYFETVLEAFTPGRLMIGTDWPVLTVASTYQQWWKTVSEWIAPLSRSERNAIEGGTAARTYRLSANGTDGRENHPKAV